LVLLAIPALLGAAVAGYALIPRYAAIAVAKVASKAFDYSLFRAAKEILYIPLGHAERTQGKAFVDMMSYRMAKGATSLMLLGLVALKRPELTLWLTLACIGLWLWITMKLNKHR
jgi:ATP/ADP translocase